MLTFALVAALSVGFLLGALFAIGFEIAIDIVRGRRQLKILRQQTAETLKEAEATTM